MVKKTYHIEQRVHGTWWETWEIKADSEEDAKDIYFDKGDRIARYEHSYCDEFVFDIKEVG